MGSPHLPLAPEAAVLLRVDNRDLIVLFCTPFSLDDLAVGHLVGRGLLTDRDSLASLFVCDDRGRVDIVRFGGPSLPAGNIAVIASGCGAGALPGELFGLSAPRGSAEESGEGESCARLFDLSGLADRTREMFSRAELYKESGGMHCAALASVDSRFPAIVREDVGRHNAVDKVIGRAFLERADLRRSAILTSGRLAADMVAKAIHAGIPVIASRSVPTTAAFELAKAFGIALVGRVASKVPEIYCGRHLVGGL